MQHLIKSPYKFLKSLLLCIGMGYTPVCTFAQTLVTLPLTGANTKGEYFNYTSITLSDGFSASPGAGEVFRAYIFVPCCDSPNSIVTSVPRVSGITDQNQIPGKNAGEVMRSVQFLDGIGRPLQNIQVQGSSSLNDLVQLFAYDKLGREPYKYLPYTTNSKIGAYKSDAFNALTGFYNTPPSGVSSVSSPFSETRYDGSPLSRIVEQGAPGSVWQLANNHTLKEEYGHNNTIVFDPNNTDGSKRVALYAAVANTNGSRTLSRTGGNAIYGSDQLFVSITKDENWTSGCVGTTEKYTDTEGKLILTRTYNQLASGQIEMLSTYYVYDQFGNLCFVLTPKAEPDNDNAITQSVLDNLCYQYRYDQNNRVIEKKIPGKGWEYRVYNKLDQLVMSQDANQRNKTPQEWAFAKYDGQGRMVMTGIYAYPGSSADANTTTPDNSKRLALQTISDNQTTLWENRDNSGVLGYSNHAIPGADIASYLSVNYYDNYDIPGLPATYNQAASYSKLTDGLPTASKTAVLNKPADMLWTVNYYDENSRIAKSFQQHYQGGTLNEGNYDELSATYSFTGEVLSSTRSHKAGGVEKVNVETSYAYDHMGRVLKTWEKINGNKILLAGYDYNDLGQLKTKKLHSEDNGNSFLQSISYAYNERGWLKSASGNLFNMQLRYQDALAGTSPQYNGNISNQLWGVGLGQTVAYEYDPLNRLTKGEGAGMSETGIGYDKMGNIQSLNRDGQVYNYNYNGNQLSSVSGLTAGSYQYDANGNATFDARKSATIVYNPLDLPQAVTVDSKNITYTYDASGVMLSKQSVATGLNEYISGIQYGNTSGSYGIDFIWTDAGRAVRQSDNTYRYQYDLTDHLGNVRLTFDKDPATGAARRIQEDNYYAFGLRKSVSPVSLTNEYLYNGKELQEELNQYDYGARFYDPVIGRWNVMDPHGESYINLSSYNYVANNPLRYIDPDGRDFMDWIIPKGGNQGQAIWGDQWNRNNVPLGYEWLGDASYTFHGSSLSEVVVTGRAMTEGERYYARYGRGDRAFYYANGKPDYAAYYWKLNRDEGIRLINAARDPALDLINIASVLTGAADAYLLGRGAWMLSAEYLATRAAGKLAMQEAALAAKGGVQITKHAAERMVERGITQKMVETSIAKGTKYLDPKNGTFNYVLKNGFASGKDLLIGVSPQTSKVTTVLRGSNLVNKRFIPQ